MFSYKKTGFYVLGTTIIFLFIGLLLIGISKFRIDTGSIPGSNEPTYELENGFEILSGHYSVGEVLNSSTELFYSKEQTAILKVGIVFAVIMTPLAAFTAGGLVFSGYY